jgi:hypothetical protein
VFDQFSFIHKKPLDVDAVEDGVWTNESTNKKSSWHKKRSCLQLSIHTF